MTRIFLSHSSKDKFFARELADRLNKVGVRVWIDEAELKVGDSLIQKISYAIDRTDYLAAILSKNSVSSNWVKKELDLAMTKEINGKKVIVLPILIDDCDMPPYLKDKLYADFTRPEKFDESFDKILKAIGQEKKREDKIIEEYTQEETLDEEETKSKNFLEIEKFQDIQLMGINKAKSYKPDEQKMLYNIYFDLNNRPPQEWADIFEAERRFPRHSMWRKAWIEDKYVIVYCVPDEVKRFHLNDIKQDVVNANIKYRQYLFDETIKKQKKRIAEQKEKEEFDKSLGGLEFK